MSKPLTIEIRPLSGLVDDFREAFKAAQQGGLSDGVSGFISPALSRRLTF
jgi:hypothetical protein